MAALRDSLDTAGDVSALRSRLAASAATGAANLLVDGLVALRLHELTGDAADLDRARAAFDRARDADGRNAWAHFGWALAVSRGSEVRSISLVQTGRSLSKELGLDARSQAVRAAERALEHDREHAPAATLLARLSLLSRDPDELKRASQALARVNAADRADGAALAAWSSVLLATGEVGPAVDVAWQAAGREGRFAEAAHTLAVALFNDRGSEEDGARMYFAAIDSMSPALAHRLYEEVRWIATPRERADWPATADPAARRQWFTRFWETRAALSGVRVSERVAEHYRRLEVVLGRYVRQSDGPPPGMTLVRDRDPAPFDERGIIYLRHGEPDARVRTPYIRTRAQLQSSACMVAKVQPDTAKWGTRVRGPARANESWVYRDIDGRFRMYNFLQCVAFPDYVIPWELPCDTLEFQPYVMDRIAYESEIRSCEGDTRERIRDQAREALTTDSDRPDFERNVPLIFDLLAFRGRDGLTELTAPLAIGIDSMRTVARTANEYALEVTVAVVDTATRSLSRRDTTISGVATGRPFAGGFLDTFVRLEASPSDRAALRITVRNLARSDGSFFGTDIQVPDYSGDSLMLSSIVLALPGDGEWRRAGRSLRLMPYGEYETGEFLAFYEIYNLADSAAYDTELVVQPAPVTALDPLRPPAGVEPIRLRFEDEARVEDDGVTRALRRVESRLPPGRYRITVTVTDRASGRRAVSWRPFVVPRPRSR